MTVVHAIVLGIIQGITEFLPVSSSGHLILLPAVLGWTDQGIDFDVMVHLGTLLAVIIYFRSILVDLFLGVKKGNQEDIRQSLYLVGSIIPAGIVGLLFGDQIEEKLRSPILVALSLIVWAIVLYFAQYYEQHKQAKTKQLKDLSLKQVVVVSFAQVLALFPGTSRSGITMTAGMFTKANKKTAAEFSFLMSIPVIASAGGLKLLSILEYGSTTAMSFLAIGFVSSAIAGYVSISFLMKIIEKWSFTPFVIYRIVLGVFLLMYFL